MPSFGEEVIKVSLGHYQTCILLKSGSLHCWGDNRFWGLGLGHTQSIGDNEFATKSNSAVFEQGRAVIARFEHSMGVVDPFVLSFDAIASFAHAGVKSYVWSFGDGKSGTGASISHTFSTAGSYLVSLTVTDILGQTHEILRTIVVGGANAPPYVSGRLQKFAIAEGKKLAFTLRGAVDRDSSSFTYCLAQAPAQGTLSKCMSQTSSATCSLLCSASITEKCSRSDDLTCIYQAPSNFSGDIAFFYKANDGVNDSPEESVTMQVTSHPVPVQISTQVNHACALFDNKKIKCWGVNNYGQLGYAHTRTIGDDETIPTGFVNVGSDVLEVATGKDHVCVLLANKEIKCWGDNRYGQLFRGNTVNIGGYSHPSSIDSFNVGAPVKQVVAGNSFSCALTDAGQVKCWGGNFYGQLGLGHTRNIGDNSTETPANTPFVQLGARVLKLDAGLGHVCALLRNKRVRCWGRNYYGQLGLGHSNNIGDDEYPLEGGNLALGGNALDIDLGEEHSCVLLEEGDGKCWGHGAFIGVIGENSTDPSTLSTFSLGATIKKVAAGRWAGCVLLETGRLRCWGGVDLAGCGRGLAVW